MEQLNEPISRRAYRCDQCNYRHAKCDKLLPRCSVCVKRNVECTLLRKIVYNKTVKNQDRFKKSKGYIKEEIKEQYMYLRNDDTQDNKLELSKKIQFKVFVTPKEFNFSYYILNIFNNFQRKSVLENLLNLIQNPSPFIPDKSLSLFLVLTEKLGLLTFKPKKLLMLTEEPKESKVDINPILRQALLNFLFYNNHIFPMFFDVDFNFTKRPLYLKMAILTAGLVWMEQTKTVSTLVKYFEGKLFKYLSVVYRIKPTFENVQIILITITGLANFTWVCSIKEYLLSQCYRIAQMLQLNSNPKYMSKRTKLERINTYCLLNAYYHATLMTFGSYFAEPNRPTMLQKLRDKFEYKILKLGFNFYHDDIQVRYYCFSTMLEFYYEISHILFYVRLFKESCVRGQMGFIDLGSFSFKISNKMTRIKETYLAFFDNILVLLRNSSTLSLVKDFRNCISFFFHMVHFFIFSWNFNQPEIKFTYQNNSAKHQLSTTNGLDYVKLTLAECYAFIDYSCLLLHRCTLALDYATISICLVFMIRYGGKGHTNITKIENGIQLLKDLSKFPCAKVICTLNINLLEMIKGYTESTD